MVVHVDASLPHRYAYFILLTVRIFCIHVANQLHVSACPTDDRNGKVSEYDQEIHNHTLQTNPRYHEDMTLCCVA